MTLVAILDNEPRITQSHVAVPVPSMSIALLVGLGSAPCKSAHTKPNDGDCMDEGHALMRPRTVVQLLLHDFTTFQQIFT